MCKIILVMLIILSFVFCANAQNNNKELLKKISLSDSKLNEAKRILEKTPTGREYIKFFSENIEKGEIRIATAISPLKRHEMMWVYRKGRLVVSPTMLKRPILDWAIILAHEIHHARCDIEWGWLNGSEKLSNKEKKNLHFRLEADAYLLGYKIFGEILDYWSNNFNAFGGEDQRIKIVDLVKLKGLDIRKQLVKKDRTINSWPSGFVLSKNMAGQVWNIFVFKQILGITGDYNKDIKNSMFPKWERFILKD